jgi:hypothetical protein
VRWWPHSLDLAAPSFLSFLGDLCVLCGDIFYARSLAKPHTCPHATRT